MPYTNILYHIVIRTHKSAPALTEAHERLLYTYILSFCNNKQCKLYRINGMPDHVHMLVAIHPSISVAGFVHDLKLATNKILSEHRAEFPYFEGWERGYCAISCDPAKKEGVVEYIKHQKEHHKKLSFREEYISFLEENNIPYNPLYV